MVCQGQKIYLFMSEFFNLLFTSQLLPFQSAKLDVDGCLGVWCLDACVHAFRGVFISPKNIFYFGDELNLHVSRLCGIPLSPSNGAAASPVVLGEDWLGIIDLVLLFLLGITSHWDRSCFSAWYSKSYLYQSCHFRICVSCGRFSLLRQFLLRKYPGTNGSPNQTPSVSLSFVAADVTTKLRKAPDMVLPSWICGYTFAHTEFAGGWATFFYRHSAAVMMVVVVGKSINSESTFRWSAFGGDEKPDG